MAASFHMVCSPERCITLVESIRARRSRIKPGFPPPIIVWEPVPDLCTPDELENLQEAAKYVNVVSPNGPELNQFFVNFGEVTWEGMMGLIRVKAGGPGKSLGVVVRNGADGSRLCIENRRMHLRAYHQNGVGVVDPTGGGNTYLGALAVGLARAVEPAEGFLDESLFAFCKHKAIRTPNYRRHLLAVLHATIAASCAIEQVGMPLLVGDEDDCWNGQKYKDRFAEYIERERSHILKQIDDEDAIFEMWSGGPNLQSS